MSKFHINKKGVPAPCKAIKGKCPLGDSDSHYESKEEAQKAADEQNKSEFGIIKETAPNFNSNKDSNDYSKITDKINNSEVLKNLHKISDETEREKVALKEVNGIIAENIKGKVNINMNEAYKDFNQITGNYAPWDYLKKHASNKNYSAKITSVLDDEKKIDKALENVYSKTDIKAYEENFESSTLHNPKTRLNVLVSDKKLGKRQADKLINGELVQNVKENSSHMIKVWEDANEAVQKSNVDWSSLSDFSKKYIERNPSDEGRLKKLGFAKFQAKINSFDNIEKVQKELETS